MNIKTTILCVKIFHERQCGGIHSDQNRQGHGGSAALCPECGDELEVGTIVQFFDFMAEDGFRCISCKLILAPDLTIGRTANAL